MWKLGSLKMIKITTFVFLIFTAHVKCDIGVTEITASGDGDILTVTTSPVAMIDENGEISSSFSPFNENSTATSLDAGNGLENTTLVLMNEPGEETTTVMIVTDTTTIVTETSTTDAPTTSTTTEATTTTSAPTTTTIASTTTTTAPTTTTVKTTTHKTTTTSTTVKPTPKVHPKMTTSRYIPQAPTVEPTSNPETEGKSCKFIDLNLVCNEEITCYGEGEIDCGDEEDNSPAAFVDKFSPSSSSEDYPDFESTEATIGTFPPDLVGVASQKKRIPYLFNMRSLGTTELSMELSSGTFQEEPALTETTVLNMETSTSNAQVLNEQIGNENGIVSTDTKLSDAETPNSLETTSELPSTTSPTSSSISSQSEVATTDIIAESDAEARTTTQIPVTMVEYVTSQVLSKTVLPVEDISAPMTEESSLQPIVSRKKRQDNTFSSSQSSSSFHVAALESSKQKIRRKTCKLTGNLVCTPAPTISMCKGKTYCQVVSSTAETSEKSTSAKGVETWAIAVITICAIAAALTISLLVYLVVTSWKKLKVQPQNGVTTLTYVNNTPP